jgi:hypothetical protein
MKYERCTKFNSLTAWWLEENIEIEDAHDVLGRRCEIVNEDELIQLMVQVIAWRQHPRSQKKQPWKITWSKACSGGPGSHIGERDWSEEKTLAEAAKLVLKTYGREWRENVKLQEGFEL